ncbi:hypothetical protein SPOG_00517 [Schizosaccharomyces cryophilus OY26]|uniref:Uncharacterized protein n=1 Tax=Schizosaccharomyces cryophilus (strain OY26 / ATCC MYA-4695 / CBS 11777 / NBRC 106824 / NRRL Y48691) TaxID=653667 RepID=S9X4U0_SCHCR|nr:uncharacterized protein SPOG_00517 [Schizosaccharomyces cryophilus OY26]EPY52097.1 hypothetical protein SPOG_00517 [Schizosaccharomyces cryophilus OY26]
MSPKEFFLWILCIVKNLFTKTAWLFKKSNPAANCVQDDIGLRSLIFLSEDSSAVALTLPSDASEERTLTAMSENEKVNSLSVKSQKINVFLSCNNTIPQHAEVCEPSTERESPRNLKST